MGKGAGCPILRADSAGKVQTLFVNSKNSSLASVLTFPGKFFLLKASFEKTKMYSWMSLSMGLAADSQVPHAVEGLALDALFHIISPLIKKPISSISWIM